MKSCAWYVAEAKRALGDERMSDRQLGELLGYAQQTVAKAKSGSMSDPLALKIAAVLKIEGGELLLVAHAEREPRADVKAAWLSYAKNVVGRVPQKALGALCALTVALGMLVQPQPALAGSGGDER